jgi:hypothetical protein
VNRAPVKNGVALQPERIGYPAGGLPDENSYLKLLLVPLGLYGPLTRFIQVLPVPRRLRGQQPAESSVPPFLCTLSPTRLRPVPAGQRALGSRRTTGLGCAILSR